VRSNAKECGARLSWTAKWTKEWHQKEGGKGGFSKKKTETLGQEHKADEREMLARY
jgi:hypothetical protein